MMLIADESPSSADSLAKRARAGDAQALEELMEDIRQPVYGLALRMTSHPQDAEDATQEIMIRVITHLSEFEGRSAISTWVYRIAANHLINERRKRQREAITFEEFGADLDEGLSDVVTSAEDDAEQKLLAEEVRLGCTLGMLQCLDEASRMVYVLGEIMEMDGVEGGRIMEIAPSAFRKRLSRGRQKVRQFMSSKCGIVNPSNPCRCVRRIDAAVKLKRVDPANIAFATNRPNTQQQAVLDEIAEIREIERSAALFRSHPDYQTSAEFLSAMKELIRSKGASAGTLRNTSA